MLNPLHAGQTWSSTPWSSDVASSSSSSHQPITHTSQPIVTGTSVLGLRYKDGVMMATDTLASYGSMARFMNIQRMHPLGEHTVLGASGDMSDMQYVLHEMDKVLLSEFNQDDGHSLTPQQLYAWLARLMYNRRSKIDPLWNSFIVGGYTPPSTSSGEGPEAKGKPFLGFVDLLGVTYQSSTIATGFGMHLAQPLLRTAVEGKEDVLTEEQARAILEGCMKVLFYRDARSLNRFQIATINSSGVSISEPKSVPTSWGFAEGLRGYGPQTQ
ncbi:putative PRE4-20S proteasome subunit [Microstroma glucosiphilum]|uniref:Proteasome subunit beta n=1 Tax=Pseudomicrostroma glucosiphilum TaxID=1684307 RepID=A0A316U6M2_9BASI|nr:putative PRE4-20S proteasome subunit [Pseudomicrostroma glucosiphilum]PWN20917.1 putative PRE4-20S proteasome subunit [Pseudomicrostroma glucosiphilum]